MIVPIFVFAVYPIHEPISTLRDQVVFLQLKPIDNELPFGLGVAALLTTWLINILYDTGIHGELI